MTAPAARLASPLGRILRWGAGAAFVAVGLLALAGRASVWAALAAAVLLFAVLACGVIFQSSGVFARPLISVETSRREVAITFDDGPGPHTAALVAALGGHRATFFVIGERATPEALAAIARAGHEIENHSLRHSYLTPFARPARLAQELLKTSTLIEAACGRKPRWFRPPVGLLSPRVARAAKLSGLQLVGWTATARDGVAGRTAGDALARLEPHLRPGAILVLHDAVDRRPISLDVLPRLLQILEERQLKSVTLDELLEK
jgi:peptidoglycan/xylan/chitin deacetylase (PgdA/CDA1 family)